MNQPVSPEITGSGAPGAQAGRHWPAVVLFLSITSLGLTADLASKELAFERVASVPVRLGRGLNGGPHAIPDHEPVVVIPGVLSLHLTTNTGAVFGLGKGGQHLFVVVSVVAVAFILYYFYYSPPKRYVLHLSLALLLAGALGNLYDRLRFNLVRDLLWLFPDTKLWPWIFNVADAALVVGTGLLVFISWRDTPESAAETSLD